MNSSRNGGYLSESDKTVLKRMFAGTNFPDMTLILDSLHKIKFDPEYQSQFSGKTFEGDDKKFYQALDKIHAHGKGYLELDELFEDVKPDVKTAGRRLKSRRLQRRRRTRRTKTKRRHR